MAVSLTLQPTNKNVLNVNRTSIPLHRENVLLNVPLDKLELLFPQLIHAFLVYHLVLNVLDLLHNVWLANLVTISLMDSVNLVVLLVSLAVMDYVNLVFQSANNVQINWDVRSA